MKYNKSKFKKIELKLVSGYGYMWICVYSSSYFYFNNCFPNILKTTENSPEELDELKMLNSSV